MTQTRQHGQRNLRHLAAVWLWCLWSVQTIAMALLSGHTPVYPISGLCTLLVLVWLASGKYGEDSESFVPGSYNVTICESNLM